MDCVGGGGGRHTKQKLPSRHDPHADPSFQDAKGDLHHNKGGQQAQHLKSQIRHSQQLFNQELDSSQHRSVSWGGEGERSVQGRMRALHVPQQRGRERSCCDRRSAGETLAVFGWLPHGPGKDKTREKRKEGPSSLKRQYKEK